MSFDVYSKSIVAPAGGVNFGLKPHLYNDKFWYAMNGMCCDGGVIQTQLQWGLMSTPSAPTLTNISFCYVFITETGAITFIVITATKVYNITNPDTGAKTDITGAAVLTGTDWSACTFNGVLYLTNKTDGVYKWTGAGNIVAIATAPLASFITFYHEHLIALGNGTDLLTINWAKEFDDSVWTPAATNDAGGFNFTDSEALVCAVILGDDLILYRRESISSLSYIGGDLVFLHRPLISGVGAINKYSVVSYFGKHLVLGRNFAYGYSGGNTIDENIGLAINKAAIGNNTFYPQVDFSSTSIRSYHNHKNKSIHYMYTSIGGSTAQIISYSYEMDAWSGPFLVATSPPSLGVIPVSFKQDINPVSASGTTYIRELFVDAGSLYEFTGNNGSGDSNANSGRFMETGDIFLNQDAVDEDGNPVSFPLSTIFSTESINLETINAGFVSGAITMAIGYRNEINDDITWSSNITLDPTQNQATRIPIRYRGRIFRLRFTITNNETNFILVGYQFKFITMGDR